MRLLRSPIVRRLLISFVIGLVLAWGMSEVSFALLRDSSDHVPQRVELDIPAGTADRVAAGEAVPSLPPEMVFVVGDVLVVRNDDLVSHQLGPVWVPPGSSASLALERPDKYSYACSFQPSRYLGLDVRSRVTLTTRVLAIVLAGPPMGVLIGIYSLIVRPVRQPPAARPALP
ncbi:MAG: hypothetical protein U0Z44_14095 [Kouleothrix sp.]|jgi:hypothetical protein|nr:hypothetical protein [Kouleothrix sp.]